MHYLYLDESGDLGNPSKSPGASQYFVVTILEVAHHHALKSIEKAITETIKNKIYKKRPHHPLSELKASKTSFEVKQYFYHRVAAVPFRVHAVVLDKQRFFSQFVKSKKRRVYNFLTHLTLAALLLEQVTTSVVFVLDRSKRKPELMDFTASLRMQLETRIPPNVSVTICHNDSHQNKALQAVDLFAWGIFRKYEVGDVVWYDVFKGKIASEEVWPK
ncbi:MAG: DUF3800 domain-containing protein [candidate division KSB1 bacterium]|nr:DUF3800 domain-containing protein [candidate division KSB1 bacterium]MDZ7303965.1 DUF3800 domain-containing protein [candidate division KSB1 bacterium]MDZ7313689.1 DUF3800 domain-containing protein [candidate division KSB1 bacterium]